MSGRGWLVGGAVLVLVAGVVGTTIVLRHGTESAASTTAPPGVAMARVVRTNLADTTDVEGTLGYDGDYRVNGGSGTVTWLPAAAAVITRGHRLLATNGVTVPLFYGDTPFYRPLQVGVTDGHDVRVLEENLAALGYGDGFTVDDHFTELTKEAVEDWQANSLGLPESQQNGIFAPSAAVVEPGPVRVTSVVGNVGTPAGGQLLELSGTTHSVTVPLDVSQQDVARVGAHVTVKLPDNSTTPGTITEIGTVVTAPPSVNNSNSPPADATPTLPVTVRLDRPGDVGRLDAAPVTVTFTTAIRRNVLAVPVNALVALREGGYAVEVTTPSRHLVAVRTGLFANNLVEVSGTGLIARAKVVTAQ